jgi:hypothetical protein
MKVDGNANFNANKDVVVQLVFPDKKDTPLIKSDGNSTTLACVERAIYKYRPNFLNETLDNSTITSSYNDTT